MSSNNIYLFLDYCNGGNLRSYYKTKDNKKLLDIGEVDENDLRMLMSKSAEILKDVGNFSLSKLLMTLNLGSIILKNNVFFYLSNLIDRAIR